jgi:DNA replication and repair protein RecF
MRLNNLILQNFRSYEKWEIDVLPDLVRIEGPNGAGKTNLLEAIYLLSTGKSFRADLEAEMLKHGESFMKVIGQVEAQEKTKLEVILNDGSMGGMRKKFLINDIPRRMVDFFGRLSSVLFGPWDMELLDGSPGKRRNFLDFVLSQTDREYRRSLVSYEKGIRQRNKLLENIREGRARRAHLMFWDSLVIKNGNYLSDRRREFFDFMNGLSGFGSGLYEFFYDRSEISMNRLEQYANEEVAAGVTLVGPHRDDFVVKQKMKDDFWGDVSKFGSRGEQRMAVLWLKFGEIEYIERKLGVRPILLLDDIFSELDAKHRNIVMEIVGKQQTIMTSAEASMVPEVSSSQLIELP